MENIKGWKTIVYGLLIAVLSVVSSNDMQAFVGEHLPAIGGLTGTAIIILRALTDSPIFQKGPAAKKNDGDWV